MIRQILKKSISILISSLPGIKRKRKQFIERMRREYNDLCPAPSIISSKGAGGIISMNLNLPIKSPTVLLWIPTPDFVKFVSKLSYYLGLELERSIYSRYPIGKLDDIEIHFNHYKNWEDAHAAWNKRKGTVDFNNLYIIADDIGLSDEDIIRLEQVKCKRMIIFTALKKQEFQYTFQLKQYEKDGALGAYSAKDMFGIPEFEKCFNYAKWLNGEKEFDLQK